MLRTLAKGVDCCLTVTHVDALVLARSGFHHSINYRAVMIYGRARKLEDPDEKLASLEAFVERMYPGRWPALRPATRRELKATTVLWMEMDEASAKIRTGPPIDDDEDYALPIWAGLVPVRQVADAPLDDGRIAGAKLRAMPPKQFTHIGLMRK
jgi:nitroimidazol reductase NimA-like FMN-containing flavoprotein (pyridoxamine 5'-phosphate oxidase superfamily)